jgi:hypothetical protein
LEDDPKVSPNELNGVSAVCVLHQILLDRFGHYEFNELFILKMVQTLISSELLKQT